MFSCAKKDEGENCQQRKALTSHPIRIAQFHEQSFFKSTKNNVKSHVFEQASVGVTKTSFIIFLETCCLKNRKKLLHSRKATNDKMSPPKPNPIHGPKLSKSKKRHFFHFLKWCTRGSRDDSSRFPKPRTSRLCNRTLQKLEVALFRKHEISTMNSIAKLLICPDATTRATRRIITDSLLETSPPTLGFNPHLAPGAQDVVRWRRA